MSSNCPFCNIAEGKISASIVYQNTNVIAFMDVNPSSVGHTLVAPRCHLETIIDVPEKLLAAISSTVKSVSAAVNKTIEPDGVTILQLNGRAAGQSVMHFHVHIIPRFKGDSISKALGAMVEHHGTKKPKREELDQIAKKIRENL